MSDQNNIPKHWQVKKLGEVCNVLDNLRKPINSTERQQRIYGKSKNELFPYYGATGQVGWIDSFITDSEYILVGEDGAPFLDLFKDKAYKIKGKTWVNNHAHILNGKENIILNDFALYYLNSINYREFVNGTTRLKLTKSNLVDIPFVVPPIPEQLAIVSKIEELLSDLENGKQQLQTAQQQLKIYRQSLLKWAFEGRFGYAQRPPNSVKEAELPKGWKMVTVKDVCLKIVGGGTPSTKIDRYWVGDIPWISSADIYGINDIKPRRKITSEAIKNSATNLLPEGGIIVVTRVGLGKLAVAPFDLCFSQDSQGLVLNEKYLTSKYALWVLYQQVQIFRYQSRGTTINGVTKKQLADLLFPLPPLEEQQHIVDELESKLTVCDKIEETISQSLQQAETLRQSILKKAFEGKLI
jgi:type I restriction enzyme, S subunit